MSLMHMKKRYRLDSEGTFNSSLDSTPPVSDVEEDDLQRLKVTPFNKVRSGKNLFITHFKWSNVYYRILVLFSWQRQVKF